MEKLYSLDLRTLFVTTKSEGTSFILICLYIFFEYVRPQSIYTQIDIVPWLPLIIICTLLSLLLDNVGQSVPSILNKFMVLYGLVVLASSAFGTYPALSFQSLRVFFDWFLFYFLIVKIVNNEKRFFIFILLFLLCSFKMSQHGFLSWMYRGFTFTSWGITGAPGWFHNSGEVGIQMCIFVPLSVAFIFAIYKSISHKWLVFFLLMPFTGIGTAVASSSRGAVVGLAGAGIWSILRRPKVFFLGGLAIGLIAIAVFNAIPEKSMERFESSGKDATSLHRIERWEHGLDTLNKYPLLGAGFSVWSEYYPAHYDPEIGGSPLVHNIFVQCASELGYCGLAVFIALIINCFLLNKKVRQISKNREDKFFATMSYGFDGALIGFLVSGSFVTVLYYPYFWIHCSLVTCLHTVTIKKFLA